MNEIEATPEVEVDAEVQDNVEGGEEAGAQESPELYTITVDGEEMQVDLETLKKDYQLAQASHKRFQQAAEIQKQNQQLQQVLAQAKRDPSGFMNWLGIDPKGFSEEYLIAQLEEEMMSPEERKISEYERELQRYKAQEEREAQQRKQAEMDALTKQAAEQIDNEIADALQDLGYGVDNPPPARVIARIADYMLAGLDSKGEQLSAKNAYARVKKDYEQDIIDLVDSLEAEKLVEFLPKSVLDKIRKYDVQQAKSKAKENRPAYVPRSKDDGLEVNDQEPRKNFDKKWDAHFRKLQRGD